MLDQDIVDRVVHFLLSSSSSPKLHSKIFISDVYACEQKREHLVFDKVMFEPRCDECFTIAVGFAENGFDHHIRPLGYIDGDHFGDLIDFIGICQRYRERKNATV